MNKRNEVVRERLDEVDEGIMLALQEGPQGLGNLSELSEINYNTCRQRLDKLIRYQYLAKPGYGTYALSDKGRRFIEELTMPVSLDLKDAKLKKLIAMLPTELHRAFFRLLLSGIIAKYHLSDSYDDGYPAFILGGNTKSFKTAMAKVVCRLLGLKPEMNIYPLFSAVAGEFGVRRFKAKAQKYSIAASPLFKQPFVCLDEFDKVTDKDTKRNVLFFLDGRRKFPVEGEVVENHVCAMLTLNTRIGKEDIARFGVSEAYIRRSIVADTEHVRTELRDVDLVAKRIFELKDFPKVSLDKLQILHTKLPDEVFSDLRRLLIDCTKEAFQGLIDTRPLVILTLGRTALLGGDMREAMYQTLYDRLVCLESLGGTLPGWRDKVLKEWNKYKRQEQPEIEKQLREAEKKEKERIRKLDERKVAIEEKKVEHIDADGDFIFRRAQLSNELKARIQELGSGEPLAATLRWLLDNVNSARTLDQLDKYEESYKRSWFPKVQSRLDDKHEAKELEEREKETAKSLVAAKKVIEQNAARVLKERVQEEKAQRNAKISDLKEYLKRINEYLRRKELRKGEDPVLILQQLRIIRPIEGDMFTHPSRDFVTGYWSIRADKLTYIPPPYDFADYDCEYAISTKLIKGIVVSKIYKSSEEVQSWTSWTNIWPLLHAKKVELLDKITRLRNGENIEGDSLSGKP